MKKELKVQEGDNTQYLRSILENSEIKIVDFPKDAKILAEGMIEGEPYQNDRTLFGYGVMRLHKRNGVLIEGNNSTVYNNDAAIPYPQENVPYSSFRSNLKLFESKNTVVRKLNLHSGNENSEFHHVVEFEHGIHTDGCENILLDNIKTFGTFGCGIYLGGKYGQKNIWVINPELRSTGRMGLSVSQAENTYIKNLQADAARGPFDVEPPTNDYMNKNIVLDGGKVRSNGGFYAFPIGGNGIIENLLIQNVEYETSGGTAYVVGGGADQYTIDKVHYGFVGTEKEWFTKLTGTEDYNIEFFYHNWDKEEGKFNLKNANRILPKGKQGDIYITKGRLIYWEAENSEWKDGGKSGSVRKNVIFSGNTAPGSDFGSSQSCYVIKAQNVLIENEQRKLDKGRSGKIIYLSDTCENVWIRNNNWENAKYIEVAEGYDISKIKQYGNKQTLFALEYAEERVNPSQIEKGETYEIRKPGKFNFTEFGANEVSANKYHKNEIFTATKDGYNSEFNDAELKHILSITELPEYTPTEEEKNSIPFETSDWIVSAYENRFEVPKDYEILDFLPKPDDLKKVFKIERKFSYEKAKKILKNNETILDYLSTQIHSSEDVNKLEFDRDLDLISQNLNGDSVVNIGGMGEKYAYQINIIIEPIPEREPEEPTEEIPETPEIPDVEPEPTPEPEKPIEETPEPEIPEENKPEPPQEDSAPTPEETEEKPFYKKTWFIAVAIALILIALIATL